MHTLYVTLRNEQNGEHAMFYYDEYKQLVCFTYAEGHNEAAYAYYTNNTVPSVDGARLDAFKRAVQQTYSGTALVFNKRLRRNRRTTTA